MFLTLDSQVKVIGEEDHKGKYVLRPTLLDENTIGKTRTRTYTDTHRLRQTDTVHKHRLTHTDTHTQTHTHRHTSLILTHRGTLYTHLTNW